MKQLTSGIGVRKRASKLSPEVRREQLLMHATKVFARRGLGAGRHAEIAEESQVSVPTVFSYFPTREILVREVLKKVDLFLFQVVKEALDSEDLVYAKMLAVTRAFGENVDNNENIMKIWLNWSTAMRETTWPLYEELQTKVINLFTKVIEKGQREGEIQASVNAEIAAHMIVSGGHMIVQMKIVGKKDSVISEFLNKLVFGSLVAKNQS